MVIGLMPALRACYSKNHIPSTALQLWLLNVAPAALSVALDCSLI